MIDRFKFRYLFDNKLYEVALIDFRLNKIYLKVDDKFPIRTELDDKRLIQCTGVKDKNGKLIYEGDIIKLPNDYGTYGMFAGEKREVYFYEGGFRLKPKWDKSSRGNWLEDTNNFEVIGNIYENPELLKDGE